MRHAHRRHRPTTKAAALALALAPLTLLACDDDGTGPAETTPVALDAELVIDGLESPLYLTAPEGDDRLFVVQRGGEIVIVDGGSALPTPFLDVSGLVDRGNSEQGLLGMAFHPDYASNGYFYVNYTDTSGDTQVVRYTVSADPNVADAGSALPILSVDQPFDNHNGGMLAFGPDGMLYVGMGDGGDGGDPQNHGQRPETLLGSMLRLDVDGGTPYAIPAGNPFVGHATAREETWAYGLRNPWRFSFDRQTGDLYIGDVGQNAREEVNYQPASSDGGENYGWRVMEGSACYQPSSGCSQTGLTLPVLDYAQDEGECAVTGGYVYRGSAIPDLEGRYLYADFCRPWVRSFVVSGGQAQDEQDHQDDLGPIGGIASFGEDADGEIYLVTLGGSVYKLVPAAS